MIINLLHTCHLLNFQSFTIIIVEPRAYNILLHPSSLPPLLLPHPNTDLHYSHHHSLINIHPPNTLLPALTVQPPLLLILLAPPLHRILPHILLPLARNHLHLAPLGCTIALDQDPTNRFTPPFIFFAAF